VQVDAVVARRALHEQRHERSRQDHHEERVDRGERPRKGA